MVALYVNLLLAGSVVSWLDQCFGADSYRAIATSRTDFHQRMPVVALHRVLAAIGTFPNNVIYRFEGFLNFLTIVQVRVGGGCV